MDHLMAHFYWPLVGWGVISLMMLLLWFIQLKTHNAGLVDIGWTWGLMILAGIYGWFLEGNPLRQKILFVMVLVWGLRLSWLLINRFLREGQEDRRYQKLRRDFGEHLQLKLLGLFLFEGALDLVLSVPYFLICSNPHVDISGFEWTAIFLWVCGFLGEVISDEQMRQFKAEARHRNKVCRLGLWNYSRHPNYFFEWLMWLSYALWAFVAPGGWMGISAPVIMYFFLIHVTGVPLAEEMALASKGEEYRQYQRTTSFFVPLPKIRG